MPEEKETFRVELTNDEFPELDELSSDLLEASRSPDKGEIVNLKKFAIDRLDGFKFEMYAKEHPPPHFHVLYNDKNAAFSIPDCELITPTEVRGKERRFIERWAEKNQAKLIDKWNESRPDDCPVGPIKQ